MASQGHFEAWRLLQELECLGPALGDPAVDALPPVIRQLNLGPPARWFTFMFRAHPGPASRGGFAGIQLWGHCTWASRRASGGIWFCETAISGC